MIGHANDYDGFSKWYDLVLGDWDQTSSACLLLAEDLLESQRHDILIDIACGTGINLAGISRIGEFTLGIDKSAAMLQQARCNLRTYDNVMFVQADWAQLAVKSDADAAV